MREVNLHMGDVYASDNPAVVRTTLGSCVAVCLFDPIVRVGGMNHYMLPMDGDGDFEDATRYGLQAMEVLMASMQRAGARRDRIVAKIFGGAHVLNTRHSADSVPSRNLAFIEQYVLEERLVVAARDVGGTRPRRVHFYTDSGRAMVKRLGETERSVLAQLEVGASRNYASVAPPPDITLFDE